MLKQFEIYRIIEKVGGSFHKTHPLVSLVINVLYQHYCLTLTTVHSLFEFFIFP